MGAERFYDQGRSETEGFYRTVSVAAFLVAGTPDTLLGRPVKTSAYMPVIAAGAKTIAFGDFSYYWIADRQGRSFKRLNELYAANGQVGFLGSQRVDGKLVLSEAVKVLAQKASA